MLRILVVLPFYGGSLPVGRFAVEGLRETGCLVETFEAPAFYSAYEAIKELKIGTRQLDTVQNNFLHFISQAVVAKAEAFAPDLVLSLAQAPLGRSALQRLRKNGIPSAMWFVEDFRLFTYWRAFAPLYDIFAVIQKEPFTGELAGIGVRNVLYLPLAASPSFHRPLELSEAERQEYGAPLSFLGAGYPNRRTAFVRLAHRGLKIWGTEWEDEPALAPLVQRGGARVSPEDAVRVFNATDINLNLHSFVGTEPIGGGDFVNPRTFEVAACGAFQLADRRGLMPELFEEEELALFDSMDELEERIDHFQRHPEERTAFALRGRQRVLAEHTYAARMTTLLDFARERLEGFGKRREHPWPAHMPQEMRDSLQKLMDELALPADAGFDDVIAAVRGKSVRLSDTETALLFLDEWKKLYMPEPGPA